MNFLIYGKFDFLFYQCKDRDTVRKIISRNVQKGQDSAERQETRRATDMACERRAC